METLIIILITLIFGLIFFNIINNKRFSLFSFVLFILLCIFYYFKFSEHLIYTKLSESIDNLNTYCYIFIIITFIIAIVEYYCGYKHISKKININNDNENNTIKEEVFVKKDSIDIYRTYLDMFDEPIAVLYNDEYIINNCMKKVLKYNSNNIEKKKFYSFIHSSDRNSFINNTNIENFRLNINSEYEWFESVCYSLNDNKLCLIRKTNNISSSQLKLKSFKDMINIIDRYESNKKDYYLVFFNINNYSDLITFYGNDFTNLIVNKHLNYINKLAYINSDNFFYISKNEYALLIDNLLEYNILLSELENNSSILSKNDIIVTDNKIVVRGKVGAVASSNVKNKNSSYIVNKGLELLKLACDEDYGLEYAIFHEIDEEIDYTLRDLNIDLNFDFTKYKKRVQ